MNDARSFRAVLLAGTVAAGLLSAGTAQAQAASASEVEELRQMMKAQAEEIEALRAQLDGATEVLTKSNSDIANLNKLKPSFKATPEFRDGDWKFKIRGRLMYDVGYISNPGDVIGCPSACTKNLGFNSRVRRARIGVEGSMPGGFDYKAEYDFADNSVAFADVFLEYKPTNTPISVRVGHFETFQSLEQITSSRHIMFMERAQMNEAFGHGRRLGAAIGFDKGPILIRAGVFNDTVNGSFDNDQYLVGMRGVYAPKVGDTQLHFGINYQYRQFKSTAQNFRYRMRNYARLSDIRLVDTNTFAASNDETFGLEAAAVMGRFHFAGEWQQAKVNALTTLPTTNGDSAGTTNRLTGNPKFNSWYVEAGYWFTGETRGYKKGEWDRTKVINGFDKGGIGAIGGNVRFDRLDLQDSKLWSGGSGTSTSRGGKQDVIAFSVIWQPIDYVRITTQYNRNMVTGGPFASTVVPNSESSDPANERSYDQDSFAMRFAYDF
jgi:phosphate-selective porin OprO and OprP